MGHADALKRPIARAVSPGNAHKRVGQGDRSTTSMALALMAPPEESAGAM